MAISTFEVSCLRQVTRALLCALATLNGAVAQQCTPEWHPLTPRTSPPGVYGEVRALAFWDPDGNGPSSGVVVAAGFILQAGDVPCNNIATWDPETGEWGTLGQGLGVRPFYDSVSDLAVLSNGDLVAAGQFGIPGYQEKHIARWTGEEWVPLGGGVGGTSVTKLLPLPSGGVVVAGSFWSVGSVEANNIALWTGSNWQVLGDSQLQYFNDDGLSDSVHCLALHQGEIYADAFSWGGHTVLRFDTPSGLWMPVGPDASWEHTGLWPFRELASIDGKLYGAMGATEDGYKVVTYDAESNSWQQMGQSFAGAIYKLTKLPSGRMVALGEFELPAIAIAEWNAGAGLWESIPRPFEYSGTSLDDAITIRDGEFLVGGDIWSSRESAVTADAVARYGCGSPLILLDPRDRTTSDGTDTNATTHKTSHYYEGLLGLPTSAPSDPPNPDDRIVLRRGDVAQIDVVCDAAYSAQGTTFRLTASDEFAGPGNVTRRQLLDLTGNAGSLPADWCFRVKGATAEVSNDPNPQLQWRVHVEIATPPDAGIGEYRLRFESLWSGMYVDDLAINKPLVLLFNPWNPADQVYVSTDPGFATAEQMTDEYVLNTYGQWWSWNDYGQAIRWPWYYHQFHSAVLLSSLHMLDGMSESERSNAIAVANRIAMRVNSSGGPSGLLYACWSDFLCDLPSWSWLSASVYFQAYKESGYETIATGQCNLFAGTSVAALRSLGIPSRTISVRDAGIEKDSPANNSVDLLFCQYKDAGNNLKEAWATPRNSNCPLPPSHFEFPWNYHVWGEMLSRPANTHGGSAEWYAFDPSPMEMKNGTTRQSIAAVPVRTVLERNVSNVNAGFLLSAIDADISKQTKLLDGTLRPGITISHSIGTQAWTKRVGTEGPQDILFTYKSLVRQLESETPVSIEAPPSLSIPEALDFIVGFTSNAGLGETYTYDVTVWTTSERGDLLERVGDQMQGSIAVPAGQTRSVAGTISESELSTTAAGRRFLRIVSSWKRASDEAVGVEIRLVSLNALPVRLTVLPDDVPEQAGEFIGRFSVTNTLQVPVEGLLISFVCQGAVGIGGSVIGSLPVPPIGPGESAEIATTFERLSNKSGWIDFQLGSAQRQFSWGRWSLVAGRCPCDLNQDGLVDDADFLVFLAAYNVAVCSGTSFPPECPADFTADGVVLDDDFVVFVAAYNNLLCP